MLTEENIIDKIKNSKSLGSLIKSINKNEDLLNYIINYTQFLTDVTIHERLHCIKENIKEINKCKSCNKEKTIFDNKYKQYRNWCNNSKCKLNVMRSNKDPKKELNRINKILETKSKYTNEKKDSIKKKTKETLIKKYGVDSYAKTEEFKNIMIDKFGTVSPFSLPETHKKSKETLKHRYGVDHNFKIDGIQTQIENTFIENYGTNRPAKNKTIKNKIIDTNNKKYGGNSPMCNTEIQKKSKETHLSNYEFYGLSNPETLKKYKKTMMDRYGYESVLHNEEIFHKILSSIGKYKIYKFPSGKEVYVQGYEDYVIDQLLEIYDESDIIISNKEITECIGIIYYENNDSKHKYYPDIYIKSTNTIIEVKSEYTYKKDLEINEMKKDACLNMHLNFEFIIVNKNDYNKYNKQKLFLF